MFCSVDEDVQAYGLLDHRHTPEIEQVISPPDAPRAQVLFTPHLAPMNRGILATCYARPTGDTDSDGLLAAMSDQYSDERVRGRQPDVAVHEGDARHERSAR